jgi:DNA-binding response OmpR family regulator
MRNALPDLIISDLNMPRMSGFELLSVVRRRFPQLPVIAITGEYSTTSQPTGVLADAIFHKSQYSPDQLFTEIKSLLERAPIRPHLPKSDKAPVWIPRNCNYVVLTCTDCLRSFSIPPEEAESGPGEVRCLYCNTRINFSLEPKRP